MGVALELVPTLGDLYGGDTARDNTGHPRYGASKQLRSRARYEGSDNPWAMYYDAKVL